MSKKKLVILSGAGISAESGLKTFRDADGLWEGHDVMAVATPEGWQKDQELVLKFYNARRKQLLEVHPNSAHHTIASLETYLDVTIITQNVDDLHERAGSSDVIHIHGELLKVRSIADENTIYSWKKDLHTGDLAPDGKQLRPHVVWFGEAVPLLDLAARKVAQASYVIIVGTSMQVYPAASLIDYAPQDAHCYFVDPSPSISGSARLEVIAEKATVGIPKVAQMLIQNIKK